MYYLAYLKHCANFTQVYANLTNVITAMKIHDSTTSMHSMNTASCIKQRPVMIVKIGRYSHLSFPSQLDTKQVISETSF